MFTSRKVITGSILLVVGVIITIIKGDIPTNLLSLMQTIYGAFILGHTVQHASTAFSAKKDNN